MAECNPSIETVKEAWLFLRPLLHTLITRPSAVAAKEVSEEVIKFDTILRGDLQNIVALFRDTVDSEKRAHEDTKKELTRLNHSINRVYRPKVALPDSPMFGSRPPSPIPYED